MFACRPVAVALPAGFPSPASSAAAFPSVCMDDQRHGWPVTGMPALLTHMPWKFVSWHSCFAYCQRFTVRVRTSLGKPGSESFCRGSLSGNLPDREHQTKIPVASRVDNPLCPGTEARAYTAKVHRSGETVHRAFELRGSKLGADFGAAVKMVLQITFWTVKGECQPAFNGVR